MKGKKTTYMFDKRQSVLEYIAFAMSIIAAAQVCTFLFNIMSAV